MVNMLLNSLQILLILFFTKTASVKTTERIGNTNSPDELAQTRPLLLLICKVIVD